MHISCFTSFSCAYLSRARVLAQTLRAAHPDWWLTALLVDRLPGGIPNLAGFDAVVPAEALGIDGFPAWMFRHDLVEGCTAMKGRMLQRLLQDDVDAVIYLDPDIAVFHGLHAALAALRDASVVLTPHHTDPNDMSAAIRDNERTTLRFGVFNLGFLAVRKDAAGLDFARWWADRLHEACYDDPDAGLFTDQRYCDLVPGMFDGVHILRDPGSNVASWNLSRRHLAFDPSGRLLANGVPLGFYHFSKIDGAGDAMIERYAGPNICAAELLACTVAAWHGNTSRPLPTDPGTSDTSPTTRRSRAPPACSDAPTPSWQTSLPIPSLPAPAASRHRWNMTIPIC